jgi:hypothetical protein
MGQPETVEEMRRRLYAEQVARPPKPADEDALSPQRGDARRRELARALGLIEEED